MKGEEGKENCNEDGVMESFHGAGLLGGFFNHGLHGFGRITRVVCGLLVSGWVSGGGLGGLFFGHELARIFSRIVLTEGNGGNGGGFFLDRMDGMNRIEGMGEGVFLSTDYTDGHR